MLIRNKSDHAREIVATGDWVDAGETVDVPDEVARGTKPTGELTLKDGTPNPEYRAGTSGLLAQEAVWEPAPGPGKSDAAHAKKADKDEEN